MPRPQESAGERRGDLGREGRGDSPSCRRPTAQSPPLFGCLGCVPWAQTSRGPSLSGPRREGDLPSTPPADLMEHKFLGSDQQHLRFPAMSVCRDGATVLGNGVL
ncbi:unnamed protein product [Rangifer tarandus platyrhynchus]|uniref:Uncharacterized protein n=2 Tax=Rangifer tarandus platyrhynchus TaxID=3082113 RepID=A0ACB0E8N4_RANTA|nr:unnamed protein product [Rangifer tarandus platyrhynchus]CAI9696576.1 unnamed protein product [Rangifer tarandus platyrhynchus]